MRIAVIGSGHIGGALPRRLAALGHDVTVANSRGPESLTELAAQTGASAAPVPDAVAGADVVMLAVPLRAVPELDGDFAGRLVVDANNYYPGRDGTIEAIETGTPSSLWVASTLRGGARVVKAFNTMNWRTLLDGGRPAGDPDRLAIPVAGDEEQAKAAVSGLVDSLGFDPVDAGR